MLLAETFCKQAVDSPFVGAQAVWRETEILGSPMVPSNRGWKRSTAPHPHDEPEEEAGPSKRPGTLSNTDGLNRVSANAWSAVSIPMVLATCIVLVTCLTTSYHHQHMCGVADGLQGQVLRCSRGQNRVRLSVSLDGCDLVSNKQRRLSAAKQ